MPHDRPLRPSWATLGPSWGQFGANLVPFCANLGSSCLHKQKYKISLGSLINFRSILGHLGVMLGAFWFILVPSWAILGPFWATSGFLWGHFGPSWGCRVSTPIPFSTGVRTPAGGHLGPSLGHFGCQDGPCWPHDGLKMANLGSTWAKGVPR